MNSAKANAPRPIAGASRYPPHHRAVKAKPAVGHTAKTFSPAAPATFPKRASEKYKPASKTDCTNHRQESADCANQRGESAIDRLAFTADRPDSWQGSRDGTRVLLLWTHPRRTIFNEMIGPKCQTD